MLAQAAVQHQGQVLFQPVQADGPEWDVHVAVRALDDQPGRRFGEAHQGPPQASAMTRRLAWPINSSAEVSWNPRAAFSAASPPRRSVITSRPDGPSSSEWIRNAGSRPLGARCIHTAPSRIKSCRRVSPHRISTSRDIR